jgi:hypothetical protein
MAMHLIKIIRTRLCLICFLFNLLFVVRPTSAAQLSTTKHSFAIGLRFSADLYNSSDDNSGQWNKGYIPSVTYNYKVSKQWQLQLQYRKVSSSYYSQIPFGKLAPNSIYYAEQHGIYLQLKKLILNYRKLSVAAALGIGYGQHYYNIVYYYVPAIPIPEAFGGTPFYTSIAFSSDLYIAYGILPHWQLGVYSSYGALLFVPERSRAATAQAFLAVSF